MSDERQNASMSGLLKAIYIINLAVLAFTGFGQMPIMKRYYIADLPGMAWTADFYTTLMVHYIAASVFLALILYFLVSRLLLKALKPQSVKAIVRAILFILIIITGLLLASRNTPWIYLPPRVIVAATFTHLGSAMIFLIMAATWFRFGKKKSKA